MQDWEFEVADANRIDEFLSAYQSQELTDDERFTLMEMIIQSFEDLGESLQADNRWQSAIDLLDANIRLHAHSVWYWSCLEESGSGDLFFVSPSIRVLLQKHFADLIKSK
ncbi:MAG: hypothetical protein H6920_03645 [Sphingomonadaceae bacterium]|nr:hypothetical protein [Sphingomonadaceae bacterium]MCP5390706.1 hypothetical protein [Sphingomonadaceae bacterium]MCP5393773.1 hypothetical protein [Sphingomonadaceae bacterium]